MKKLPPLLVALVCFCHVALAQEGVNSLQIQIPSGPLLNGTLEVIDASSGQWAGLKTQLSMSDESGFTGYFSTPSGGQTELEGKFQQSGGSLQCSLKWNGTEEIAEGFMMLVLLLPAENSKDAVFQSGENVIDLGKIYEGVPTLNNFDSVSAFTMGPIEGKTINVTSAAPLSVEVKKFEEKFYVRLSLTPRKAALPASGSVEWTMTAQ